LLKCLDRVYGRDFIKKELEKLIQEFKEDIIVLSGNLYEIPNKILNIGENQAEEALIWWKRVQRRFLY
jgi:DNA polymerase-3 subunit alpha